MLDADWPSSYNRILISIAASIIAICIWTQWTRQTRANLPQTRTKVAVVEELFIHPIKSCRGISVQSCAYTPAGLKHDRVFMVVDASNNRFVTARRVSKMVLINVSVHEDPSVSYGGQLRVSFPEGSGCPSFSLPLSPDRPIFKQWHHLDSVTVWKSDIDGYVCEAISGCASGRLQFHPSDSENAPSNVLSKFIGFPVHLVAKGFKPRPVPGTDTHPHLDKTTTAMFQDAYPLLLASIDSLGALLEETRAFASSLSGELDPTWSTKELEMRRFRPNIVVSHCPHPYAEDDWVELEIGDTKRQRFSVVSKCARCLLPNVDTLTGVRDKHVPSEVLRLSRLGLDPKQPSKVFFGCNAVPLTSGVLKVGDPVYELGWG